MNCKKLISVLLCLVILVLVSPMAYATQKATLEDHSMALYFPDDFTLLTAGNLEQHADLLKGFDTTVTQTQLKFEGQNYLLMGISQTMNCTLSLSCVTDSVSATVGDLITYPDLTTAKTLLLGKQPPEQAAIRELEQRGALFYRVDFGVTQGIGRISYITVMNGKSYTLSLIDNNGNLNSNMNALIDTVFDTWEYTIHAEAQKTQAMRDKITTIFYWICLPIGLVIGGLLVHFLIKDLRAKEQNRKRKENTPKKPRR